MAPIEDYFYRYPLKPPQLPGRCRVRIYQREKNTHVILLTEAKGNTGEPIAAVGAEIATGLVARWKLSTKNSRWIEHVPGKGDKADSFGELKFSWNKEKVAGKTKWAKITLQEAEELTDDVLSEEIDTGVGWDMKSLSDKKKNR